MGDEQQEDQPFVYEIGPVKVDVARSLGFFGGLALAVGFELVAPELALFIAAVPLLKLLKRREASLPERAIASVLEGAAKPVGGDAESTVRPKWVEEEEQPRRLHGQSRATRGARSS